MLLWALVTGGPDWGRRAAQSGAAARCRVDKGPPKKLQGRAVQQLIDGGMHMTDDASWSRVGFKVLDAQRLGGRPLSCASVICQVHRCAAPNNGTVQSVWNYN